MAIEKFGQGGGKGEPFTNLHTETAQAIRYDLALAAWCYLQSKPSDWVVRKAEVCAHFGWGEDRWLRAMRGLRAMRLVRINTTRDARGRIVENDMMILSVPEPPESQDCELTGISGGGKTPVQGSPRMRLTPVHTKDRFSTNEREDYKRKKEGISPPAVAQENPEAGLSPAAGVETQPSEKKAAAVPVMDVVGVYHEVLGEWLPHVQKVTDRRRGQIRQRWIQDMPSLPSWRTYFEQVAQCPFLLGQVPGRGEQPPFRANIEWLTNPTNYTKVIEGKYDDKQAAATPTVWLAR